MYRITLPMIVIALSQGRDADAEVRLRWKFAENTKATTTVKAKTHQILTVDGQEVETRNEETIVVQTKSGKRAKDGTIRITGQATSLKVNLTLPGGVELKYDSSKKVEPQGTAADFLLELFAAIPKVASTTVYDKSNRVVSVEVDKKPFEALPDNAKTLIKGRFDPDYLKTVSNSQLDRIPAKPINKGDTWSVSLTARVGGGQTLTIASTYRYEGVVQIGGRSLDRISFVTKGVKLTHNAPDSPIKVTASDLKVAKSSGALLFDRKIGQVVSEINKMHIKGKLTLNAAGKKVPAKLDLKIEKEMSLK